MNALRTSKDLDALLESIGDAPVVMLGEASHGTHEFYTWRTAISKRLIAEKGFRFIAVEGDWPDCYKINRFIKGYEEDGRLVQDVLHAFDRWPTWMWANWETAALADWLKAYNKDKPAAAQAGFYGLDVYSLWDSMQEMEAFLREEDPEAAQSVREAIRCFQPFEGAEHDYARHTLTGRGCRDKVVALLREIRKKASSMGDDPEARFSTEQNALVAVNAEKYYSSMVSFDNDSWNVRDTHMMETFDRLLHFHGEGAKGIVWEHNTHIGDARATDMRRAGMVNIGQLAREQYGINKVYLVGFGAYEGTVIAGDAWGAPMQEMEVPAAREGSVEHLLHTQSTQNRYLLFDSDEDRAGMEGTLPHRAIGVVYDPRRERYGNYVPSKMTERYDAFIYLDAASALHPMHYPAKGGKMPDTYPFGM